VGYPPGAPGGPGYPPAGQPPQGYPQPGYGQRGNPPQGYAQQQGYAPQQGYGVPSPYPSANAYPAPGVLACRFCGSVPAAEVTFRGHQGMIVLMRFLHMKGPYCRDCGLSTFRRMTERTLIQGWWGYGSSIITPITVLINLIRRDKVASLAPPQRHPALAGQLPAPMDPGPPLLARPMALVGLAIPVVLLMIVILVAVTGG
jgi:hypothetical protein